MNKMLVYLVGSNESASTWIENVKLVKTMEEAHVVLFTGGYDINPEIYGQPKNSCTSFSNDRDIFEMAEYAKALELKKPMFGICRGLQLLAALSGAKLIQDLNHHYRHAITMYDGTITVTNSVHHQLVYPYDMNEKDYNILGWASGLSTYYSNIRHNDMKITKLDSNGKRVEPEIVYFPKTQCLGIQGHPEWMEETDKIVSICNILLKALVSRKLNYYLQKDYNLKELSILFKNTYETKKV